MAGMQQKRQYNTAALSHTDDVRSILKHENKKKQKEVLLEYPLGYSGLGQREQIDLKTR